MIDNRSKKGRPLTDCGKRNRKIAVRFTKGEYQVILELEKTLGMLKTDLVRGRLLQDNRIAVVNAKELIGILNGLGAETGKCDNNINQLPKYTNVLL